ncbi:MAG TPA: hypothetical protein VLE89_00685 [Chlamydiales bacterium]|nr:hypothetical protein [Chlamydiales bacterium]
MKHRLTKGKRFTLLEVMVGITLLLLASGLIGWKMHGAIQKKRFSANLERFKERCALCQRLAMVTQADWRGLLKQKGDRLIFETTCIESKEINGFAPLTLDSLSLYLDGKKADDLTIEFFSTGQIYPQGLLLFRQTKGSLQEEWSLSQIFQAGGEPLHPEDI